MRLRSLPSIPEPFLHSFHWATSAKLAAMKWIFPILGLLLFIAVLLLGIGFALPARTNVTRTVTLKESPEEVFAVLADVQKMPEWNRNMKKIEMLEPINGKEATKQTFQGDMTMTIVTTESAPPNYSFAPCRT
jgi:hypothetical protein